MNGKNPITALIQQANSGTETTMPRLVVILHPNTTRMAVTLNDRMFNTEKYYHSRKREAIGPEKEMINMLEDYVVGIEKASPGKNTIHFEISDGMRLREFVPQIITIVKQWGKATDPEYDPEIYVENRRWEVAPEYDEEGWTTLRRGVRERPDAIDIGVPYQVWEDGK